MSIIYADTLFAVNFSMDFLSLYIAGKSLRSPIRPLRLAGAAALGAVFATLFAVFSGESAAQRLIWGLAFIACTAGMCALAYSGRIIRSAAVFIAVNLGLGGMISAMCGWLRMRGLMMTPSLEPFTLLVFAGIAGAVSLIYRRLSSVKRREVSASFTLDGTKRELRLLVDSGNLLCEPISRRPVIVVSPSAAGMGELTPDDIPPEIAPRLRAIPAESVTGKRVIYGFASEVIVEGRAVEAIIAPVDSDYGGLDGIIPEILA